MINIEKICGKTFRMEFYEPFEKAILIHYLHNYHNGVPKYYKKDATKILDSFVKYKNETQNISLVKENALQQLLFDVENVPFPMHENHTFKFIDLFAGVGGFRIAMQKMAESVFSQVNGM